ncbi:hypothetical protein NPIL_269801 [Nephila pilipes]|uniref:Uncharacterized protein n=1 Tax=Nephila pilipes TaxID=299642 RepID=A0A8X6Q9G2_NEPPI|nr:hypothetical protein NPIL_269801 [Nephila pilipes]
MLLDLNTVSLIDVNEDVQPRLELFPMMSLQFLYRDSGKEKYTRFEKHYHIITHSSGSESLTKTLLQDHPLYSSFTSNQRRHLIIPPSLVKREKKNFILQRPQQTTPTDLVCKMASQQLLFAPLTRKQLAYSEEKDLAPKERESFRLSEECLHTSSRTYRVMDSDFDIDNCRKFVQQ